MGKLTKEQKESVEKFQKNFDKLTCAQKHILKRTQEKISCSQSFQDNWLDYEESYGTDYNDCHGDYYDAEAEN